MGVTNIGNETRRRYLGLLVAFATTLLSATALADGIVATVVSSPLSSTGTVSGYPTGINIYLQSDEAQGYRFMDPAIEGYGVPAGGRIEVEMLDGFERIADEPLEGATLADISLVPVSGTPQQSVNTPDGPLVVSEGANPNTFVVAPVAHGPVTPDDLTPGVPGSAQDAIQNRGIKVFHVGINPAFRNVGESGTVAVRIYDGDDTLVAEGTGTIDFLPEPGPQIFPTNLLQGNRNHNWQRVAPGATVGQTDGTVPLSLMLYQVPLEGEMSREGRIGVGVVSVSELAEAGFEMPEELSRYTGGLIIEDLNGDWILDPAEDRVIGGVMHGGPDGASGEDLRSAVRDGAATLSRPTTAFTPGAGRAFGGAILLVQYTVGDAPGHYRPTFALLADPDDLGSGDGSSYTYTVVVE